MVEAPKQNLDGGLAIDPGLGQRLAKRPDGVGVGNRVGKTKAEKAHEGEPVLDEIFGSLVRKIMACLQDQSLEHEDMIKRRPAAFRTVLTRNRLLQIGAERFKVHDRIQPLKIVAFRR